MLKMLSPCSIITGVSNIVVQVFEHHFGALFDQKPPSHSIPQLKCFDYIPSTSFLCVLTHVPHHVEGGLKIAPDDLKLFQLLKNKYNAVGKALKLLKGRNTAEAATYDSDYSTRFRASATNIC